MIFKRLVDSDKNKHDIFCAEHGIKDGSFISEII